MDPIQTVREALALGSDQHPSTMEPVYVWTDAEAALDRIEAVVTYVVHNGEPTAHRKAREISGLEYEGECGWCDAVRLSTLDSKEAPHG